MSETGSRGGEHVSPDEYTTFPTEQIPGGRDVARYAESAADSTPGGPAQAPSEPGTQTAETPAIESALSDEEWHPTEVVPRLPGDQDTGPVLQPDTEDMPALPPKAAGATFARSGTTPAEAARQKRARWTLDLSTMRNPLTGVHPDDLVRDLIAVVLLATSLTSTWTWSGATTTELPSFLAVLLSTLVVPLLYVLRGVRFGGRAVNERQLRWIRLLGMVPAAGAAVSTIVADLVLSFIVVLGPQDLSASRGIGIGVALALTGALLGAEPRRHEGWTAHPQVRRLLHVLLRIVVISLGVSTLLAVAALIPRGLAEGATGVLVAVAAMLVTLIYLVLLVDVVRTRRADRFVVTISVFGVLLIGGAFDTMLRLDFAAPQSFVYGYVSAPFAFALVALLMSRTWVDELAPSFVHDSWRAFGARLMEFSLIAHAVAVLATVLLLIARQLSGAGGITVTVLSLIGLAALCVLSWFVRAGLRSEAVDRGRSRAVLLAIAMVALGFLGVIVTTIAFGTSMQTTTGGLGLFAGLAVVLAMTVPASMRERYGAPDFARMWAEAKPARTADSDSPARSE